MPEKSIAKSASMDDCSSETDVEALSCNWLGLRRASEADDTVRRLENDSNCNSKVKLHVSNTHQLLNSPHDRDITTNIITTIIATITTTQFLVHGQVTIIFVVSVCLFVQSFSQPPLIRFQSNKDICYMSGSSCVP